MVKHIILSILLLISFVTSLFGQDITASAFTDTSDYLVGDYIYFSIKVDYDNGVRISPPSLTDKLGPLEVVKVLPATFSEKNSQQFNYIIAGYDSLRAVIPPLELTYFIENSSEPQTVKTNEVVVFIHTLELVPNQDIKDVKDPIRIPFDWLFWLLLSIILVLLGLAGYYLYKKFKKPEEEIRIIRKTPPLPIHLIALRALDKLDKEKLWQQGKIKEYHSEITGIIRKYFEDRYNFNSLEMTTSESMKVLNRLMDNQKLIDTTARFLENADMVKFAKYTPLPSINEEMMKQAYEIVEKTRKDEEPVYEVRNVL